MPEEAVDSVIAGLEEEFSNELVRRDIERIWAAPSVAILTIVGAGIQRISGIAGRVFSALGDNGVNIIAIAQGSSECSISVVVEADDVAAAVGNVHRLIAD
ncbi:MAG: ACT domain-containing protein [Chloroflexota bacterium]